MQGCGLHRSKWALPWDRQVGGSTKREQRIQVADKGYVTTKLRITWHLRSLTLFLMKIGNAAITNLNRHQRCCTVNGVERSSPQGKAQHIIHSLSATHLSRKVRSNWFLDQKIPARVFDRILVLSQVREEQMDETKIIATEGLTTCLHPGWGLTIMSRGWNFLKKQECWKGHEQVLILTIQK